MAPTEADQAFAAYVRKILRFSPQIKDTSLTEITVTRIEKALSLLPAENAELFLSSERNLAVMLLPDTSLPIGMTTRTEGPADSRRYTIELREEHQNQPEDLFLGGFLRELAHVVAGKPPESEWPSSRGERARFKERIEYAADAMVWRWGLRHYNLRFIAATYPPHWADRIVEDIEKMLREEDSQGTQ